MERKNSPGRWAHRVFFVSPTQELRRQQNKKLEREGEQLSNFNASPSVATTKTHERPSDHLSFTNRQLKNKSDQKSPRIRLKPPSLPSTSVSCFTLITPQPTATQGVGENWPYDVTPHKSSRDALTKRQSPRSDVISKHTNEFISNGHREYTPVIPRLSKASIITVESRHTRKRGRRKSIGSRSFLSDDTNAVSSGFETLQTRLGVKRTTSQKFGGYDQTESKPPLLRKRRNSYPVNTGEKGKSSRAEYLKAFNDSIRLRNARMVCRRQRPATANLPDIASTESSNWRKLRHLLHSAPVQRSKEKENSMDSGTNDSWEEFVALGMPKDDFVDIEKPEAITHRSIQNITSSREHERVLNEFRFNEDSTYRKDGVFKKSVMVIAGGIKSMSVNSVGKSPRSSPRTPDTVIEEDENEGVGVEVHSGNTKGSSKIRSRGWKIVKARLSEIAEKAPKNGIDSTPLTFRNLAQLVKAKQFRMMLKRRASFMDNGRFQFEEAKQDLYARYKLDPVLISKLTRTPRDNQATHGARDAKKSK